MIQKQWWRSIYLCTVAFVLCLVIVVSCGKQKLLLRSISHPEEVVEEGGGTAHFTETTPARVRAGLEPSSLAALPLPLPLTLHTGAGRKHEGVIGCGNVLVRIPLPTIGLTLFHNSIAPVRDFRLGAGISLSIDSALWLLDGEGSFLVLGDGTKHELSYISGNGLPDRWTSKNVGLQLSFVRSESNRVEQRTSDGTKFTYLLASGTTGGYFLQSVKDRFANETTLSRSIASGEITAINISGTGSILFSYASRSVTITGAKGEIYLLTLDSENRLTSVQYPDSSKWTLAYEPAQPLIRHLTTSSGSKTQYLYYFGGLLRAFIVDGFQTSVNYTADQIVLSNGTGKITEKYKDGRIISEESKGVVIKWDWYSDGSLKSLTDSEGGVSTFKSSNLGPTEYGNLSASWVSGTASLLSKSDGTLPNQPKQLGKARIEVSVSSEEVKAASVYDSDNQLRLIYTADGDVIQYQRFDPENFGRTVENGLHTVKINYGYLANVTTATDTSGKIVSSTTVDGKGRTTEEVDGAGFTTRYGYPNDRQVIITDPFGRVGTFTLDPYGSLSAFETGLLAGRVEHESVREATLHRLIRRLIVNPLGSSYAAGTSFTDEQIVVRSSATGFVTSAKQTGIYNGNVQSKLETIYDSSNPRRIKSSTSQSTDGTPLNLIPL